MTGADRSVTDVVAFVLMFSIIILSVALVSTAGIDSLSDLRDREQVNSAERGMETLASGLEDIHRQGDTFRRVRLAPNDGHIRYNATRLTISVTQPSGGTEAFTYDVGALDHRLDVDGSPVTVSYEAGGVFRSDGGTPRFTPVWRCAPDRNLAVVSLVNLTTDETIDEGGGRSTGLVPDADSIPRDAVVRSAGQSVDLAADTVNTTVAYTVSGPGQSVSIDVSETSNPRQWRFYFERQDGWSYDATADTGRCSGVSKVLVRVTTIRLSV